MISLLPFIPERSKKKRNTGITMVMDKGLSLNEAENLIASSGELIDLLKFGFGTCLITNQLTEKIKLYKQAGITPYFGGTLFEMYIVRGMFDDFCRLIETHKLELAEISDGSILLPFEEKLKYIEKLSHQVTVISEVGSKMAGIVLPHTQWVNMMQQELAAGSWKVIAEARESGNVGIYNLDGSADKELIHDITSKINSESIIWEAPNKAQQAWFIKLQGSNVNLGNIAPNEVIALETLRLGLRGDTFFQFLPADIGKKYKQI